MCENAKSAIILIITPRLITPQLICFDFECLPIRDATVYKDVVETCEHIDECSVENLPSNTNCEQPKRLHKVILTNQQSDK